MTSKHEQLLAAVEAQRDETRHALATLSDRFGRLEEAARSGQRSGGAPVRR